MKYLSIIPLLLISFSAVSQKQNVKFRKVQGKVTDAGNHPLVNSTVEIYGANRGTTTDREGKFSINSPNDRAVVISINNHKEPGYIVKINPQDTFLNIKLDAAARVISTKNLAVWNKNEPYNSTHAADVYHTEAYYEFVRSDIPYSPSITIDEPAKPSDEKKNPNAIYTSVEKAPQFKNGTQDWDQYLSANLKYPESAKSNNVQGRVVLMMVVEKDGSLTDVKVIRGLGDDCDKEALRLVRSSPKWIPATANAGMVVRCSCYTVVTFKLD